MLAGSSSTTSIFHGASSCRNASAIDAMADFEAASGPPNGGVNRSPIEPMKTTRPRARRSIGRNACVTATWPDHVDLELPSQGLQRNEFHGHRHPDSGVV